jgi:RNA polymerase sigma-70 factor (ECF subfamily)
VRINTVELDVELDEMRATAGVALEFDPFFHANFVTVARAAALVARDEGVGQEVAQEAFVRALQRWSDMASTDHARNFVYKVALNLARSHLRKHGRVSLYGLAGPEPRTDDPGGTSEERAELFAALDALSPRQRTCVVLVDYVDMAPEDVARLTGITSTTVRVHLMRGRAVLRERLGLAEMEER